MTRTSDVELVRSALNGVPGSVQTLVQRLMPVVEARVARRVGRGRPDLSDIVQDVWLSLFEQRGKKLLAYEPSRGSTLERFVGLLVEHEVSQIHRQRSAQKRGGHLQAVSTEETSAGPLRCPGHSPEQEVATRDLAVQLWAYLEPRLSERGRLVFRLVFTDGLEPADAARAMGVKLQVIYNWQHKIRGLSREFLAQRDGSFELRPEEPEEDR